MLVDCEIEFLCFLELVLLLELLSLLEIESDNLILWECLSGQLQRLLPLAGLGIHFEGLNGLIALEVVLLCEVVLSQILVMFGNQFVVWSCYLWTLIAQQLNSLSPLSALNGRLNGLLVLACLHVMVNGTLCLLVLHQVVGPTLLQFGNQLGILPSSQIYCLLVGIPLTKTIQGLLVVLHLLIEFTSLLIHPSLRQCRRYLLQQLLRERLVVVVHHVRSLRW